MARWRCAVDRDGTVNIVDTETGEQLGYDDIIESRDPDALVGALFTLGDLARRVSAMRGEINDELESLRKLGRVQSAEFYGGLKVKRDAPWKWDPKRVESTLRRLVAAGTITQERMDVLAPPVPARKPDGRKLKELLGEIDAEAREELRAAARVDLRWKPEEVSG